MKEVEILIQVLENKESALDKLKDFKFLGIKKVVDTYFFDPLRPELKPDENNKLTSSFRLRQKDTKTFLAYKVDNFDRDKWIYSDEHEVEVLDFNTAYKIIEHLGLKELISLDNEKHTFIKDDYEIVLEDVKNLGLFLEVEKQNISDDADVKQIKQEIAKFIKSLNIETGEELNVGKPELMLNNKNTGD